MVDLVLYYRDTNTSDGLTKSLPIVNLGGLLGASIPRIAKAERERVIRRKIPASKRYVVYHETIQGINDLDADMRRRARVGRCWQTVARFSLPNNSFLAQNEFA